MTALPRNQCPSYIAEQYRNRKPEPLLAVLPVVTKQCLKCNNDFASQGPSNRICDNCNEKNLRHGRRCNKETSSGTHVNHPPQRLG